MVQRHWELLCSVPTVPKVLTVPARVDKLGGALTGERGACFPFQLGTLTHPTRLGACGGDGGGSENALASLSPSPAAPGADDRACTDHLSAPRLLKLPAVRAPTMAHGCRRDWRPHLSQAHGLMGGGAFGGQGLFVKMLNWESDPTNLSTFDGLKQRTESPWKKKGLGRWREPGALLAKSFATETRSLPFPARRCFYVDPDRPRSTARMGC